MKSLDELRKIRDQVRKDLDMRGSAQRGKIVVGMGTCGIAAGARDTMKAIMGALEDNDIQDIAVVAAGCQGFCEQEPLIEVQLKDEPAIRYGHVDADAAQRIVKEHIVGGKKVDDLVFG